MDTLPRGSPVPLVGQALEIIELLPLPSGKPGVRRVRRWGVVASVEWSLEYDATLGSPTNQRLFVHVTMRRDGR
jgi:hypothetical protein